MNKKVFIQSSSNDRSTDDVICWLNHLNSKVEICTIFDTKTIQKVKINISNKAKLNLLINDLEFNSTTSFWYRRGKFNFNFENDKTLSCNIYDENVKPILDFVNDSFSFNSINKFNDNFKEKLEMLSTALEIGLNIPEVLITGEIVELKKFLKTHKKIITKPISNPSYTLVYENNIYSLGNQTKLLNYNEIEFNNYFDFLPSFFQRYIEKKFEIRTFYLAGIFKSMAIFSQENEKTKIDFRNYDHERPNRYVPYELPKFIEKKLHKLMLKLKINCGSFDLIYTPSGKYYFLEVNPIGQFKWLSENCNFKIEKIIAEKLIY